MKPSHNAVSNTAAAGAIHVTHVWSTLSALPLKGGSVSRTCAFGVTLEATRTQEGSHGAQHRCSRPGALFPYVRCPAVRVRHILDCPGSCCKRAADCHEGLEEPNQACRLGSDTVGLKLVPVLKLHKFSLGTRTGKLQDIITHQPQLSLIAAASDADLWAAGHSVIQSSSTWDTPWTHQRSDHVPTQASCCTLERLGQIMYHFRINASLTSWAIH